MFERRLTSWAQRAGRALTLCASMVALLCGCESRALEVVLCGADVSPYVTHWSGSLWGLHDYAYVRLATPDAQSTAFVGESCAITKQPFVQVIYPNESPPSSFPEWWDIEIDETVDYAVLVRHGGNWQGIAYRKASPQGVVWLLRAGS